MKYEHLSIKETLTADEYQEFVSVLCNIQIVDMGATVDYHPEYLTMTLPSILAHICIDGIEWEEDETTMYDNATADKIMADEKLRNLIEEIMPSPEWIDTTAPSYIANAMSDAEKRVKFFLDSHRPADLLTYAIVGILDDVSKLGEMIQTDNGKAMLEALNRLIAKEEKPQNRQQRRRRK